jgi:hypothetical protein
MATRAIPLSVHAALEALMAPVLIAAPLLFGLGAPATLACVAVGGTMLGLALQAPGPRRAVPLAAHAYFDYVLAGIAALAGIAIGLATGSWVATSLLVGVGAALAVLAAATRFSSPRGA